MEDLNKFKVNQLIEKIQRIQSMNLTPEDIKKAFNDEEKSLIEKAVREGLKRDLI